MPTTGWLQRARYPDFVAAALDAADWSGSADEFRALRIAVVGGASLPGMTIDPEETAGWSPLVRAWLALSPHPHMLELIDDDPPTLRYAAIDWSDTKRYAAISKENAIKVARVFAHVVRRVDRGDWVWFQEPHVSFDLRGEPRVWWLPVSLHSPSIAPEAKSEWLHPTEKLLVYALGRALAEIGFANQPVTNRCLARAILRTKTIDDVVRALESQEHVEPSSRSQVWDLTETGIGWLALDRYPDAVTSFQKALALTPNDALAVEGLTRATVPVDGASLDRARELEASRWWNDAAVEYRRCRPLMTVLDYHLALARCMTGLERFDEALLLATRAVQASPDAADAYLALVEPAITKGRIMTAVTACAELLRCAPETALEAIFLTADAAARSALAREQRQCVYLLVQITKFNEAQLARLAKLVCTLTVPDRAIMLCRHLLSLDPERGAVAAIQLLRADQAVFELAENACDVLSALPPERGTRPLLELIHRTGMLSFDRGIQLAKRVDDARGLEVCSTLAETAFQRGDLTAAMSFADHLIAAYPTSGIGLYRRGRVLFRLGKLVEARDALDRAQVIEPTLVDAMHLRREVDKAISKVRAVVGSALPQQLAIPEHLPEVRAAMARGSIPDAVRWLESHAIGDGVARLLLGNLLVGQERFADAVRAFDQVTGALVHEASIGKARALAGSGRGEEALRLLDRVVAEDPDSTEAMVVRAKVVALLR